MLFQSKIINVVYYNIENNGMYVKGDSKCYCKITNGKRAEKYPWEKEQEGEG